jgi:hypothetical protein
VPGLSVRRARVRDHRGLFFTGVYVLSRAGSRRVSAVMLVAIALMGVVYVGRRLGFVLIALVRARAPGGRPCSSPRVIQLDAREVDPMMMQNWFRMAAITSLLARCSR